jgi:MHS family shikimate/dehydroshikimate transporter-like MFS transporter
LADLDIPRACGLGLCRLRRADERDGGEVIDVSVDTQSSPPETEDATDRMQTSDEFSPRQLRLTIASSMVGTALEWYDFYLYGTAAALVFNRLFFPNLSPLIGTMAAFGSYGVGFLSRPIGGVVFGYIGDKYGRRPVLVFTVLLMGLSTTAIGLLPDYRAIGLMAPVLLTMLRMLQGFGAGAEYGSAITLAAEKAPPRRRGFFTSFSAVGISIGVLLSAGAFALVQMFPDDTFKAWGWRIPFLASLLAVVVAVVIRLYVTESPVFKKLEDGAKLERSPISLVWENNRRSLLVAFGARMAENCAGFFLQVWTLSYVTQILKVASSVPVTGVLLGAGIGAFTIPMFGALSDKIGRKTVYLAGAIGFGLFMFPYFWMINTRQPWLIISAMVFMISIMNYSMFSVQAAYFVELFDARTRVTGISLSREFSSIAAGGVAPIVASALLLWSGGRFEAVAIYMIAMSVITVTALAFSPETRGENLNN